MIDAMNRRRGKGAPRPRAARGLMLRAVVTAVHFPGDYPTDKVAEQRATGLLCDCTVIGPGSMRGPLRAVPILRQSGGYADYETWRPQAATQALSGSLDLDPIGGNPATRPEGTDGDHVIIGFLNDDLNQPVILGQIDHSATTRKPVEADGYQWHRIIRGTVFAVTNEGDYEISTEESEGRIRVESHAELELYARNDATFEFDSNFTINVEQDLTLTTNRSVSLEATTGMALNPGSGQTLTIRGGSGVAITQGMALTVGPGGGEQPVLLAPLLTYISNLATEVAAVGSAGFPSPVATPNALAIAAFAAGWPPGVESTLVSAL